MGAYNQGGGGGRAVDVTESDQFAFDQPFEIGATFTAETAQQINDMFRILFKAQTRAQTAINVLEDAPTITPTTFTGVNVVTFDLSEAQLEAMTSTSGVEVVEAPGVGYRHYILSYVIQTDITDGYGNSPAYVAILTGSTVAGLSSGNAAFNAVLVSHVSGIDANDSYAESTMNPENRGITIRLSAALTDVGVATAKGALAYYTLPIA